MCEASEGQAALSGGIGAQKVTIIQSGSEADTQETMRPTKPRCCGGNLCARNTKLRNGGFDSRFIQDEEAIDSQLCYRRALTSIDPYHTLTTSAITSKFCDLQLLRLYRKLQAESSRMSTKRAAVGDGVQVDRKPT